MGKESWLTFAALAGKKALEFANTEEGRAFLCGRYSDGSPRSFLDAYNDEIMSPASRKKRMERNERRQKELEQMIFGKPKNKKKKKGKKKSSKKKKRYKEESWIPKF